MKRYLKDVSFCLLVHFLLPFFFPERVKVAFSATLSALGNNHKFIGPYKEATSLVYENALTNIGNAYDTNTGIITLLKEIVNMML